MVELTNHGGMPITAANGITIPAHGSVVVTAKTGAVLADDPFIASMVRRGRMAFKLEQSAIQPEPVRKPSPVDLTRAAIRRMDWQEIGELAAAHGLELDGEGTLTDARAAVVAAVFVGL